MHLGVLSVYSLSLLNRRTAEVVLPRLLVLSTVDLAETGSTNACGDGSYKGDAKAVVEEAQN